MRKMSQRPSANPTGTRRSLVSGGRMSIRFATRLTFSAKGKLRAFRDLRLAGDRAGPGVGFHEVDHAGHVGGSPEEAVEVTGEGERRAHEGERPVEGRGQPEVRGIEDVAPVRRVAVLRLGFQEDLASAVLGGIVHEDGPKPIGLARHPGPLLAAHRRHQGRDRALGVVEEEDHGDPRPGRVAHSSFISRSLHREGRHPHAVSDLDELGRPIGAEHEARLARRQDHLEAAHAHAWARAPRWRGSDRPDTRRSSEAWPPSARSSRER